MLDDGHPRPTPQSSSHSRHHLSDADYNRSGGGGGDDVSFDGDKAAAAAAAAGYRGWMPSDENADTTAARLAQVVPPPPHRTPAPNASLWPQPFGPPKHATGRTPYVPSTDLPPVRVYYRTV